MTQGNCSDRRSGSSADCCDQRSRSSASRRLAGDRRSAGDRSGAVRRAKPVIAWARHGSLLGIPFIDLTHPLFWSLEEARESPHKYGAKWIRVRIVPVVPPARRRRKRKRAK